MADDEYNAKIRIEAEGADGAAAAIGRIGKAFKGLLAPVLAVRSAVSLLFKTLGTVGFIIHGIELVAVGVRKLHGWLDTARKAVGLAR